MKSETKKRNPNQIKVCFFQASQWIFWTKIKVLLEKNSYFSFENNVGNISVVETSFGFHIIEILSQTKKRKAVKQNYKKT